jgi:hypothetical protein
MGLWINKCFIYIVLGTGWAMRLSAFLDPAQREFRSLFSGQHGSIESAILLQTVKSQFVISNCKARGIQAAQMRMGMITYR